MLESFRGVPNISSGVRAVRVGFSSIPAFLTLRQFQGGTSLTSSVHYTS